MKTKILIVLEDTNRGGAETQALLLAKGLISRGHLVEILSFGSTKGSYWSELENLGVPIHLTGFKSKLIYSPQKGLKSSLLRIKCIIQLIYQVRKIKPHVILPFTYPPNIIMGQFWKYMGAKKCFWNQRDEGRMFLGKKKEIKALRNMSKIISNNKEGSDFLYNYTSKEIVVISNGVLFPILGNKIIKNNAINVVMIANFNGYKDHITLLKSWRLVINSIEHKKVMLLLAGRDADKIQEIKNYIDENKLCKHLKILGTVSNISSLLEESHIGVFSSLKEGLPNGILECMAAGLPVVATRISGALEALGEDYPYLSEPQDYISLANQLLFFIHSESERIKIGQQNRARIKTHFSIEKMVDSYESLIIG